MWGRHEPPRYVARRENEVTRDREIPADGRLKGEEIYAQEAVQRLILVLKGNCRGWGRFLRGEGREVAVNPELLASTW